MDAVTSQDKSTAAIGAVSRLADLVPFLALQRAEDLFSTSATLWEKNQTRVQHGDARLFEGIFRRGELASDRQALTHAVRTAQLLKVVDTLQLTPSTESMLLMLSAYATQEQFSRSVCQFWSRNYL